MTDREIYQNLRGTLCVCGAIKRARHSLCRRHFFILPRGTQCALYDVHGYPETFRRAAETLGLKLPDSQPTNPQPTQS